MILLSFWVLHKKMCKDLFIYLNLSVGSTSSRNTPIPISLVFYSIQLVSRNAVLVDVYQSVHGKRIFFFWGGGGRGRECDSFAPASKIHLLGSAYKN